MGKVGLKVRVMPSGIEVDMEKIKENAKKIMPEYAQLVNAEIKPVAFGLKALILHIIMPDKSPDELINKLKSLENVENVEIEDLSLL